MEAVSAEDPESVDEHALWSETVGGLYKGHIYGMGGRFVGSIYPASVTGDAPSLAPEVVEDMVRTQVHALNEEL